MAMAVVESNREHKISSLINTTNRYILCLLEKTFFFFCNSMWPIDAETLRGVPKYTQQERWERPSAAAH